MKNKLNYCQRNQNTNDGNNAKNYRSLKHMKLHTTLRLTLKERDNAEMWMMLGRRMAQSIQGRMARAEARPRTQIPRD